MKSEDFTELIKNIGLDHAILEIERKSGRSTRLMDTYIQQLFLLKKIVIIDHSDNNVDEYGHKKMSHDLFDQIKSRLEREHVGTKFSFDKSRLSIELS